MESITKIELGKNWITRFYDRYYMRITSVYLRTIDYKRKKANNSFYFSHFFGLLAEKILKYNILSENIYNINEKGFLLGFRCTSKRVVSLESLKRKQIVGASYDRSREFITLITVICADGSSLPPALIY